MTTSASSGPFSIDPIGFVSSNRSEAIDDEWGDVVATITLCSPLGPDSLRGLDAGGAPAEVVARTDGQLLLSRRLATGIDHEH